jgi:D-amino-acid oxidase
MKARPHALILGAGVIGLTTALYLLKKKVRVTVLADQYAPNLTSVVAGALWEWPPAVCGYHHDTISLARSKKWCMASYRVFVQLARVLDTGVFMRNSVFYFHESVVNRPRDAKKMAELRGNVLGFRHDLQLIDEHDVNREYGVVDAYAHLAPMIDTDIYMGWLHAQAERHGAQMVRGHVAGELTDRVRELTVRYGADLVINCTGLGAKELGDATVYPLRGALVRLINNSSVPLITAHCVSHDEVGNSQDIVFIVPRGRHRIVLGGLAEPNEWNKNVSLSNYEPMRAMYQRCRRFLPALDNFRMDETEPVRVGLRPFRRQNVRLEKEPGLPIIHCYGHGGAGVTLSWGCAQEVSDLMQREIGAARFPQTRAHAQSEIDWHHFAP